MKPLCNARRFALCACAAALVMTAAAQPVETRPMVQWVVPAPTTNKPQTAEEAESGRQRGRELPPPEVLQPMLDSALPTYRPRTDVPITGSFKGAASDVMVVLAQKWIDKFRTYYPGVTLTISPPYAGSLGAVELSKGDLDFVFVSRELRPDDITAFKSKFDYDPTSIPISGGSYRHFGALDAVVFFVNKDNPIEQITFEQLDAMYSSTRHRGGKPIAKWGDLGLGGDWADKPIRLYGIQPWNGFEEFVRQRVLSVGDKRGEWRDDIKFDKVVFPMAKNVSADRYGIGYSGVAYLDAGVKVIPVVAKSGEPPQAPTYENVALASYPLSRLTFLNVNKAPGKALAPALDELIRFVLSREGQQVVLDHARYIPLRAGQVQEARSLLTR
jgi:phosphate transport system substrate-binding protein